MSRIKPTRRLADTGGNNNTDAYPYDAIHKPKFRPHAEDEKLKRGRQKTRA